MKKYISFFFFFLFFLSTVFAQGDDLPGAPDRLVNDMANLLNPAEKKALETKLVNFDDTTSTQIAILITNDLKGYDIVDFSQRIGQKWKVGQKGKDNGVVIVIKPKSQREKGEVNIEVGYGLEPIIPDITANRIIENEMIPRFRQNDYYGGLEAGTDIIIALSAGHFTADQYNDKTGSSGGGGLFVPIVVMIIIMIWISRSRRSYYSTGGRSSIPFWTALWLGSSMGSSHRGSWGSFSSGSGGFGSSGGFGGFGGGSFGGGGASGSW